MNDLFLFLVAHRFHIEKVVCQAYFWSSDLSVVISRVFESSDKFLELFVLLAAKFDLIFLWYGTDPLIKLIQSLECRLGNSQGCLLVIGCVLHAHYLNFVMFSDFALLYFQFITYTELGMDSSARFAYIKRRIYYLTDISYGVL